MPSIGVPRPLGAALAAGFLACSSAAPTQSHQDPASKLVIVSAPTGGITGQTLATSTVQIENDSGRSMPASGVTVAASILSGGGSLAGTTSSITSGTGLATFSDLHITGPAGPYVLQFSATGLASAQTGSIPLASPATCGSTGVAPTLTGLTRDVGSAAGGDTLQIVGSGFQAIATACVLLGGTPASAVTFLDAGHLLITTPPHSAGTVMLQVVQNNDTAAQANAFDYEPAPTVTYAKATFEGGALAPLTKDLGSAGVVVVDSSFGHTGTHSAHCSIPTGSSGIAQLFTTYGTTNPALSSATGVYQRWYTLIPKHSKDNTVGSGLQMKLHISRVGGTQPPPGWMMLGIGTAFGSSSSGEIVIVQDDGTNTIGHTGFVVPDSQWFEMQTWYHRTPGLGHVKLWINGKFVFSDSSALFGSDTASDNYAFQVCIPFAQIGGPVDQWVDDVEAANGYIIPNN